MEMNATDIDLLVRKTPELSDFPPYHSQEGDESIYDVPVEVIILLSIFYGSISIIAVIGNSLVIWIVSTTRQMQTVTNLFIANLALADVAIGMFSIPFQFQAAVLQRWNLPEFMCPFCPFVQTVSVNVSVFTLTAIAVDRHRAIINPLRARPPKYISKLIITFIWCVSILFSVPMAIALRVKQIPIDGSNATYPFCDVVNIAIHFPKYRYYLTFVQYFIPFTVISFVYIQMAIRLWGSKTPGNAQDSRDVTLMRNKKRVIKMLIIVVFLFGICWFPLQLYNILHVTWEAVDNYKYINILWFCCDWLAMSNSCYNPFIYGIYNEKFKREFRRRFPLFRSRFDPSTDISEKNVSMYTRASSIRSNYTTTTTATKSKFMMPHRNNGNAGTTGVTSRIHHYNALNSAVDGLTKNNNVINTNCSNNNLNTKTTWLFTPTTMITNPNATTNDLNETKSIVCFPKVCYKNGATTNVPSMHLLYESVSNTDTIEKNVCCQQENLNRKKINQKLYENQMKRLSNAEMEFMQTRRSITPLTESDADEGGDEEGEVDFRKSIIRINNIYNSCRDANNDSINEADMFPFSNAHQFYQKTNGKLENDVKL